MRTIKFRVWDNHNKQMLEDQEAKYWLSQGIQAEYLQFTGLLDKNGDVGQEVYEGDIIDEYGKIKGNIYEMDATDSDLVITNLTGRDWCDTHKKAMDRGLTHSE